MKRRRIKNKNSIDNNTDNNNITDNITDIKNIKTIKNKDD